MDIALNNIQAFSKALREVFSDYSSSYRSLHQTSTVHQPRKSKISQNSKNVPLVTTEEGLDIMLKEGSIEDATVSVLNYTPLKYQVFWVGWVFCLKKHEKNKKKRKNPPKLPTLDHHL